MLEKEKFSSSPRAQNGTLFQVGGEVGGRVYRKIL